MSDRIFSIIYIACLQDKLEEQIKSGYLEEALETLESFPNATDPIEKTQRLIVMYEGYREIARQYRRIANRPNLTEAEEATSIIELLKHVQ